MTLFIHVLYKRHTLEIWYTPSNLHQIRILGVMGLLAGLTGMITYITFAIVNKEGEQERLTFHVIYILQKAACVTLLCFNLIA